MTIEELMKLCVFWQEALRLQDWNLRVQIKRAYDMAPNKSGTIGYQRSSKTADITIMSDLDGDSSWNAKHDMEMILVHELLHLFFAPFNLERNEHNDTYEDIACNFIADALVKVRKNELKVD